MVERLHQVWAPARALPDLSRHIQYLMIELECCYATMVVAVVYMSRLHEQFGKAGLDTETLSCQQLFTVCMMVASKYVSDMPFSNQQWAQSAGYTLAHINHLERTTLNVLNFELSVPTKDYLDMRKCVIFECSKWHSSA